MRTKSQFLLALLIFLAHYNAANGQPSPAEALAYWEINANPDISKPNEMASLSEESWRGSTTKVPVDGSQKTARFYILPTDAVRIQKAGQLTQEIQDFIFTKDGHVRFPVQPDDKVIASSVFKGKYPQIKSEFAISRSASRSTFAFSQGLSYKASTETTYGANPDKIFGTALAESHLAANQWIDSTNFTYGIPLREPLFLFHDSIAVSIRDWSPFLGLGKTKYYMPLFSLSKSDTSTLLGLLNGYEDPELFFLEHGAYASGRAQAEWALKTGLQFNTPHHQNFLIELDENLGPTGRILLRDFGDSSLSNAMIQRLGLSSIKSTIKRRDGPYIFTVPDGAGNLSNWDSSNLGSKIERYFANGIYDFRKRSGIASEVLDQVVHSGYANGTFKLGWIDGRERVEPRDRVIHADLDVETSLRLRPAKEAIIPSGLRELDALGHSILRKRIMGQSASKKERKEILQLFQTNRSNVFERTDEIGNVIRSALVWAGIDDQQLLIHQIRKSINPVELLEIWNNSYEKGNASPELLEAFLERVASIENGALTERSGMAQILYKVDKWLGTKPVLSASGRTLALQFYTKGNSSGLPLENIVNLYAKARSITPEENAVLKQISESSLSRPDKRLAVILKKPMDTLADSACAVRFKKVSEVK